MSDECDPIVVASDDAEILDQSADGAIICVADGDGMAVSIDPNSELGEKLAWHAGHRGESPEEYLRDAIREHLDGDARPDGGALVECPNGHEFDRENARAATFDGDEARYQCPECSEWTRGPPPS